MKRRHKATRSEVRRHNRRLVLNAVYSATADNRAAIATDTGLAKPTVSELIAELIEEGYLIEDGIGQSTSTGGKPPRLLRFLPDARQAIGIACDGEIIFGMLTDLRGAPIALHYAAVPNLQGHELVTAVQQVINGLAAQQDAPLACIGVAVPGIVHTESGIVKSAPALNWHNLALGDILQAANHVPVYVSNNTELAAIGYAVQSPSDNPNLVMVRIGNNLEVATAVWGRYRHGGALGALQTSHGALDDLLSWASICAKIDALRAQYPQTLLPPSTDLTYVHILYACHHKDPIAQQIYQHLVTHVAVLFAWILGIVRPDEIVLAGNIANLGEVFLRDVRAQMMQTLADESVREVQLSWVEMNRLSTYGAVAHALERELGVM